MEYYLEFELVQFAKDSVSLDRENRLPEPERREAPQSPTFLDLEFQEREAKLKQENLEQDVRLRQESSDGSIYRKYWYIVSISIYRIVLFWSISEISIYRDINILWTYRSIYQI